jgi:hypothetical protein
MKTKHSEVSENLKFESQNSEQKHYTAVDKFNGQEAAQADQLNPSQQATPTDNRKKDTKLTQEETPSNLLLTKLTEFTKCRGLAADVNNKDHQKAVIERMLIDQMSSVHQLSMFVLSGCYDCLSANNFASRINASARLMDIFQRGILTLHKLQNGSDQTVIVKHQQVNINEGGQAVIADEFKHTRGVMSGGDNGK